MIILAFISALAYLALALGVIVGVDSYLCELKVPPIIRKGIIEKIYLCFAVFPIPFMFVLYVSDKLGIYLAKKKKVKNTGEIE